MLTSKGEIRRLRRQGTGLHRNVNSKAASEAIGQAELQLPIRELAKRLVVSRRTARRARTYARRALEAQS